MDPASHNTNTLPQHHGLQSNWKVPFRWLPTPSSTIECQTYP